MSVECKYTGIAQEPSLQFITDSVASSEMENKNLGDISYHPEEHWLKVWFDTELSTEDKSILDTIVSGSSSVGASWHKETGSEYFELSPSAEKGWVIHGGRVKFKTVFSETPAVIIMSAVGDSTFDLTVDRVTEKFFDFRVRAKVRNRGNILSRIEFDWEATS